MPRLPSSPQYYLSLFIMGLVFLLGLGSCGISEQAQQAKAFKDADIRLASIEQATVAGINVLRIRKISDLSTLDQARLAAAYAAGNVPLRMLVNLEIRNPNDEMAALNGLDYIALIDGKQIATGRTTQRIEVGPNGGVALAPVTLESNLRDALANQSGESLSNFVMGLSNGSQEALHLTLRLKPTFVTSGGRSITPPGYINVTKDFTARQVINAVDKQDTLKTRP
ncbi:hypothetical protein [Hymenobacter sp.]|jgi:hypothetical protein|uniref:hypothetical protein n=1 Tax=Hymenobacter sp. TaxID=1898978 RepID=UPI002EDA582D